MSVINTATSSEETPTGRLIKERLPRTAAGTESTPYYLVTIGNAISWGSAREYLHRFGIGVNEWRVLAHVAYEPGCTAAAVSRFLRIDKGVTSRSLKSLMEKDLVGVELATDGTRALYLTGQGATLHNEVLPIAIRREQILLKGLDDEERRLLLVLLRKMHANLTEMNAFDHQASGAAAQPSNA